MFWGIVLATLAGFIGVAWLFVMAAPRLAGDVASPGHGRHAVIDGFRGLLAVSVLLHHGILFHHKAMGIPLAPFDRFLGRGAVALFFMASAALFAGQIVDRGGRLSFRRFYLGRMCRIVPLYIVAVGGIAAVVIWEGGGLRVTPMNFVADIAPWLLFDFVPRSDLNGITASADYLGMVWSLRYEWMLYAVLPVVALAYRRIGHSAVIVAALGLMAIPVHMFALFVAGAAAMPASRIRVRHADTAIAVAAGVGIIVATLAFYDVASGMAAPLLFPLFVLVLRGRSRLVGWMASLPMRFLGQISYSVYLLHGVVLGVLAKHGDVMHRYLTGDPVAFAVAMQVVFVAVLAVSTLTFLLVERPLARPDAWIGGVATIKRHARMVRGSHRSRPRMPVTDRPVPLGTL